MIPQGQKKKKREEDRKANSGKKYTGQKVLSVIKGCLE